jgi:protein-disulfide isomerase
MAKFDDLFPTPSVTGKLTDIMQKVSINLSDERYGTNPNASVTVIEFSDFQCPACSMAVPEAHKIVMYYGNRINFVFKHFPAHEDSLKAAEAAECARDQGRFWEFHDKLFENSDRLKVNDLQRYARTMLLDTEKFNKCLLSGEKTAKVEADFRDGIKYGIQGTPTFFVNGIMMTGVQPFEEIKQIIDSELENE